MFDAIIEEVGDEPIAYLEFGVFEGRSLRYWSRGLRNWDSELHGFDSFRGLPETFDGTYPAGHFNMNGQPP